MAESRFDDDQGPAEGDHVLMTPEEDAEYVRTGVVPETARRRAEIALSEFELASAIREEAGPDEKVPVRPIDRVRTEGAQKPF